VGKEFMRPTKGFPFGKRVPFGRFLRGRGRREYRILFNRVRGDIILCYRCNRWIRDRGSDIMTYFWNSNYILCEYVIYQIVDSTRIIW